MAALANLLESLKLDDEQDLIGVLQQSVVGVCRNAEAPKDLAPADFDELMELAHLDQEEGLLVVDGEGGVAPGHRIRLMLRDRQGLREELRDRLLAYKRADLASILGGTSLPPTFGVLMFSDMDRTVLERDRGLNMDAGSSSSGGSGSVDVQGGSQPEAAVVSTYMPVPLSGLYGSAQMGSRPDYRRRNSSGNSGEKGDADKAEVPREKAFFTEEYEYACVVGVLRASVLPSEGEGGGEDLASTAELQGEMPVLSPRPQRPGSAGSGEGSALDSSSSSSSTEPGSSSSPAGPAAGSESSSSAQGISWRTTERRSPQFCDRGTSRAGPSSSGADLMAGLASAGGAAAALDDSRFCQ